MIVSPLLHSFIRFAEEQRIIEDCFLVGGAVRDLLLGRPLSDYDLVLRHNAEHYAEAFAASIRGRCICLDETFGTMRITCTGAYIDLCRMQGTSIEEDLCNRDLTLNAMALPLALLHADDRTDHIIDPCGGRNDLMQKSIRMVSEENIVKDPLRQLRIYRFVQQLGFAPETQTINAVRRHAHLIETVAVERIADELRHILGAASSYPTVRLMDRDGILARILPEIAHEGKVQHQKRLQSFGYLEHLLNNPHLYFFEHAKKIAAYFQTTSRRITLKLAVLLPSPLIAMNAAERLRLSRDEISTIAALARNADRFSDSIGDSQGDCLKLLHTLGDNLYAVIMYQICQECICQMTDSPTIYHCREMLDLYHGNYQERAALLPILTGNDLIAMFGLSSSPRIGELLAELQHMTLDGRISTKHEAMEAARAYLTSTGNSRKELSDEHD